mgnify:CR=1 FL=1
MKSKKKYSYIQIGIASPEEIRSWSYGEVKKHETINYRTLKPERDGLFCEVIFGPTKDYQCACGKSKKMSKSDKKCEKCGVDITESKVRRERMGHIELVAPVVHTWFMKNSPSKIALLLDMKSKTIEDIVYFASYIVIDPGTVEDFEKGRILTEQEYAKYQMSHGRRSFTALTGAEAIKKLLQELDLGEIAEELREELKTATKQRRDKLIKRLEVVEAFHKSGNKPEWMVMEVIPVLPPDLRPMVQLDGGRFATTDLNDLYRRIITRNNRLRKQIEQRAPSLICKNEKRMLQEAVDALIDNGKKAKKVVEKNHPLKSLSDLLRGKQGRFRQNLLGKRVDFSGRSVIVVGPDLKMYQCGIPREMALILFKPFIINAIMNRPSDSVDGSGKITLKEARTMIEQGHPIAMTEMEKIIVEHPVLLNRAPTLHRLGIQAFEPKLVEGKAIRLHPLSCTAFNADFDGDQMAVHVPLSEEAQTEARLLMLASKNILAPKDGKPIVTPSQDMVLGNYYLTIEDPDDPHEGRVFKDINEVEMAYENDEIGFHTRIAIPASEMHERVSRYNPENIDDYLITTYGKIIFNTIFPNIEPYIPYICESFDENKAPTNLTEKTPSRFFVKKGTNIKEYLKTLPVPHPFVKKYLSVVIAEVFKRFKLAETSKTLDKMKDLGFKYSTVSGITVAASDIQVIGTKKEVIDKTQKIVDKIDKYYSRGIITAEERRRSVIDEWGKAKKQLEKDIEDEAKTNFISNHIYMMGDSGARGSIANFIQLSGMRGFMAKPNGESMDVPILSSFKEGLSMSDFFISTHGARKGSTDTALKTAESGYLTRRLVDVSQDVIITEDDCGTDKGMLVTDLVKEDGRVIVPLYDRIRGRFTNKPIYDPRDESKILVEKDTFISDLLADKIVKAGVKEVYIRTLLTCNCKNGVCVKCYGSDLSTGEVVEKGEVVGVIAAQSIGEPGTQLTMRTFHSGGVAGGDDITQGLPRVQELFEARTPKGKAIISEIKGEVSKIELVQDSRYEVVIKNKSNGDERKYITDSGKRPIVKMGEKVEPGQKITDGQIHPKELVQVSTVEAVAKYILMEVQKVYRSQGVDINDKHIEVVVSRMISKIRITDGGDTEFLIGALTSMREFTDVNKNVILQGKRPAVGKPILLGITKASLETESFLSAASFQETTRVLTDAAIKGKVDTLQGLKENVIIGKLIPAGTGAKQYRDVSYELNKQFLTDEPMEVMEDEFIE